MRTKRWVVAFLVAVIGLLAIPAFAAASWAAPCPPGTEWDKIQGKCIPIDPD